MSVFDTTDDLAEWENMEDGVRVEAPEDADVTVNVPADTPVEVTVEEPEAEPAEKPEPEAEPEPEVEAEPEPEPDPAALQAQIATLEKRLVDKDDFNGRLSNELGELRALQQQMLDAQQAPQVSDWDELIGENPMAAAQYAIQAGDHRRLAQAKQAMDEYLPGASEMWERGLLQQQQINQLAQRVQDTTAPLQQQQATQQIAGVYDQIRQQYPDFDQFEGAMAQLVETRPLMKATFAKVVQEGSPEEQFAYLEDLHALASGRKADTLREAAKEIANEHATNALRAKQEAQVASASANIDTEQSRTAAQQIADRIGAEWDEIEKPYKDGWNISSA